MSPGLLQTRDAVILIPGIMGSELVEIETGRVLWGLTDPRWYYSVWASRSPSAVLELLRLSAEERDGRYGRVRATRLLQAPAFVPLLAGLMPYERLRETLLGAVSHPSALTAFPYDWRLPVAHNATLLAEFARKHLADWRAHQTDSSAGLGQRRTGKEEDSSPRLVLVAHSMGGLLAWLACQDLDFAQLVRVTLTLGTPFFGAPKSVLLLSSGQGMWLPYRRVKRLAASLPGVYDLLPAHRCVTDGLSARRLDIADIKGLGGDPELAAGSLAFSQVRPSLPPAGHVQVVGAHQPTLQALTISDGAVTGHGFSYIPGPSGDEAEEAERVDMRGDGTVPRESAELTCGPQPIPLAQSHGALASDHDAGAVARDVVVARRRGPWQGAGQVGVDAPDVVRAGEPVQFRITGVPLPTDVRCRVLDLANGRQVDTPVPGWRDGSIVACGGPLPPGVYQIVVDGGGASPVTQLLMSADLSLPHRSAPDGSP